MANIESCDQHSPLQNAYHTKTVYKIAPDYYIQSAWEPASEYEIFTVPSENFMYGQEDHYLFVGLPNKSFPLGEWCAPFDALYYV